jgi:hypothetical protein
VLALVAATFDVASIKPSRIEREGGENSRREHVAVSPTGVTMLNVSLSYCIQWAYSVKFYQVEGPDWVKQQRYEIVAKTEQPVRVCHETSGSSHWRPRQDAVVPFAVEGVALNDEGGDLLVGNLESGVSGHQKT